MGKRRKPANAAALRENARAANGKRRRRRRTGRKTLHVLLVLVFLLIAGGVLCMTTFLKIEDVTVVGIAYYAPDEIAAASGIQKEDNLLQVPVAEIREKLLAEFPYIETVEITRKLPPAIEITLTQSEAAAAILEGEEIVLITRASKVLERGRRGEITIPPQAPLVQGIDTRGVKPGRLLSEPEAVKGEDEQAQEAREERLKKTNSGLIMLWYLFDAMEETGFTNITNVDVSDPLDMKVIYENRMLLKLGTEANLAHKLTFVREALDDQGPEKEGRIDVSGGHTKKMLVYKDITLQEALALEQGNVSGADESENRTGADAASGEEEMPDGAEELSV